jgi:hypothetical protein
MCRELFSVGEITAGLKNENRAGGVPPARRKCDPKITREFFSDSIDVSLGLAHFATVLFGRLLIIRRPLHIPDQTFLFAQLLEASDHLLYRFACPRLHFQHKDDTLSLLPSTGSHHNKHSNT